MLAAKNIKANSIACELLGNEGCNIWRGTVS